MKFIKVFENAKRVMFFAAAMLLFSFLGFNPLSRVEAQTSKAEKTDQLNPKNWDERDEIRVPAEDVHIVETHKIGQASQKLAPSAADAASVYSNTTTFLGQAFAPAGQANTPAITRLMADDLTLTGTAPYSIGRFDFSICNLNTAAVSFRPRVRFYLDNAGTPGTNITGFSFNPIAVAAGSCTTLFANVAAFSVTASKIWAGMIFDNSGASATAAQLNNVGMGIFNPPDLGTSDNLFYLTTAAPPAGGSYLSNNPGPGANTTLAGVPNNFGWDFRAAANIISIARANTNPRQTGGTAQWSVTTTGGSITTLSPANFALTGAAATGSTINSVVANNVAPNSTDWTVTATIGSTAGTLGLNWANVTNLNTNVSNTLPFAGETYTVNVTTAANASVGGRVLTSGGTGINRAQVTLTGGNGIVRTATSNAFGYYIFDGVASGETYILSVNNKKYQFTQPTRVVLLNESISNIDFEAMQ